MELQEKLSEIISKKCTFSLYLQLEEQSYYINSFRIHLHDDYLDIYINEYPKSLDIIYYLLSELDPNRHYLIGISIF